MQHFALSGGNLFVTNASGGTIGEYTAFGATVSAALISGLKGPSGIAVSVGDLFVAVNASLISGLIAPSGIAVTWVMALTGFAALGFVGIRRTRSEVGRSRS